MSDSIKVEITGLKELGLDESQQAELNQAVQQAVLAHLAPLDLSPGALFHFPKDWIGIQIKRVNERQIEELELLS